MDGAIYPHHHCRGAGSYCPARSTAWLEHGIHLDAAGGFQGRAPLFLTGDHIDAQEALRIGLVSKVVPQDRLLEECFKIVERIALVPPETVKLNLATAIMGMQMMGFRDAWTLDGQLSAGAHTMLREELRRPLEETRKNQGTKAYLQMRDGPFQPEPFGPRSKKQ